jgi:hypothetical protein
MSQISGHLSRLRQVGRRQQRGDLQDNSIRSAQRESIPIVNRTVVSRTINQQGSSLLRPLPFIEGPQKGIRVPTSQSILTATIVDDGEPEGTIALNNIASPVN